jgi:hypothetical protein
MKNLLLWLAPPLVGALIGYVTNALAIKMLFRPLEPVYFFRLRLPFTPGILPRQRRRLAESIGAMVERELLTPEILRQRLYGREIRETLHTAAARYTEKILNRPLNSLGRDTGELRNLAAPLVRDFFASPAFEGLAEAGIRALFGEGDAGGGLFRRSLRDILGEDSARTLGAGLESLVREGFSTFAAKLPALFESVMERSYPEISAALVRFMSRPEVHGELEIQGRVFLYNAILKLNVFQRFFISAGQYDKTLHERMPGIIDDLIRQCDELLRDKAVRERLITFLGAVLQGLLADRGTQEGIIRIITGLGEAALDRPLGELLRDRGRDAAGALAGRILRGLKQSGGEGFVKTLSAALRAFLAASPDLTVGGFLSFDAERDAEKKRRLDDFLTDKLLSTADAQLENLLAVIKVRTLVSERIDSLNMIDVERIVLDVMADQFKWINLFGALLGALIGVFQSAFTWFSRGW